VVVRPVRITRRGALAALAGLALGASACTDGRNFSVLGYSTAPNYDCEIRTVRVPVFKNYSFYKGLEFELTREVVNQIEQKTPYKVVAAHRPADTELAGTIVMANKGILNRNQLNEVREAETLVAVELVWRDLRSGEILSGPRGGRDGPAGVIPVAPAPTPAQPAPGMVQPPTAPGGPVTPEVVDPATPVPGDPLVVSGPVGPARPGPVVIVQSLATFIPELGESITTAHQKNVQRLATQIVSMMEAPW
jgi:hypothetical protein